MLFQSAKVIHSTKKQETTINYGDRVLLKALLHNCDVPREAVEKLPNGEIGSEYDKDKNKLYVCKGMDRETLFQTLSQEMGNIELKNEEKSDMNFFISYCTSYMICKKYGIDVSNYAFKDLSSSVLIPFPSFWLVISLGKSLKA